VGASGTRDELGCRPHVGGEEPPQPTRAIPDLTSKIVVLTTIQVAVGDQLHRLLHGADALSGDENGSARSGPQRKHGRNPAASAAAGGANGRRCPSRGRPRQPSRQ